MDITLKLDVKLIVVCVGCACIAVIAMCIAFPELRTWAGNNSSNLASWVQAVGSIGAIIGTAIIARMDGLRRAQQDEEVKLKLTKQAKYDLHSSNVLYGLQLFLMDWRSFDRIYKAKNVKDYLVELKMIFFFRFTKRSFFRLVEAIDSLDEYKRERLSTGLLADDFTYLFSAIKFCEKHYSWVNDLSENYASHLYGDFIFQEFSVDEGKLLVEFNEEVTSFYATIIDEKDRLINVIENIEMRLRDN